MPDAIITSTASTFGTISGTFAADQSTITGTVSGIVPGTLTGSVGVPGPAGSPGAPGVGVPAGGTAGQYLQKIDGVDYNTDWVTLNLSGYALLSGADFTGRVTVPGLTGDVDTFSGLNIGTTSSDPTNKFDGDLWVYDDAGITPVKFRVFLGSNTYNVATESWVSSLYAPLASPVFTGDPRAPTPASGDNDNSIATTAFVKVQGYAPLASPAFTGTPSLPTGTTAVTQTAGNNTTAVATTAFVRADNNVKAWVNFNGTGTPAIRASFNVSSLTDNGVGSYRINFTTAMVDANYVVSGSSSIPGTDFGLMCTDTLLAAYAPVYTLRNSAPATLRDNTLNLFLITR